MATFRVDGRPENIRVSEKSTVSMAFEGVFDEKYKNGKAVTLATGDIVVIGELPAESFTTHLSVLVVEGFPAASTVDIGFWNFIDESFTNIVTGLDCTTTDISNVITLPTSGVINGGGIRAGSGPVPIAMRYTGADAVTGKAVLLAEVASYEGYFAAKARFN